MAIEQQKRGQISPKVAIFRSCERASGLSHCDYCLEPVGCKADLRRCRPWAPFLTLLPRRKYIRTSGRCVAALRRGGLVDRPRLVKAAAKATGQHRIT